MVDEVLKELDRLLDDYVDFVFMKAQENLVKINPEVSEHVITDTGMLLRSGRIERKFLSKEIVWDCPYADFIEFGTSPHPVSAKKLAKWVERKLRIKGRSAYAVAHAVAKKIEMEGTEPKPFVRNAINQAERYEKFRY